MLFEREFYAVCRLEDRSKKKSVMRPAVKKSMIVLKAMGRM